MPTDTVNDLASYQQFALQQQQYNNEWSAKQAQKQMDFQRDMSNTAHQREVADLKAAGLNPILSVNSGASVPSGASGDTDTSAAGNVGAILQQVLQAQNAREVAGMYNAATIAAASIAANASMYNADTAAETQRDYPNTLWGNVRALLDGNSSVYGTDRIDRKNPGGSIFSEILDSLSGAGSGGNSARNHGFKSAGSILQRVALLKNRTDFIKFLGRSYKGYRLPVGSQQWNVAFSLFQKGKFVDLARFMRQFRISSRSGRFGKF